MNTLLLVVQRFFGVLTLMFGMGVGMAYLHRKQKYEQSKDGSAKFEAIIVDLKKALKEQFDMMVALAGKQKTGMSGTMPMGDNVRVYGALLARGLETRLVVVPSKTFEDMVELVTKEYGLGWIIAASCYLDMEVSKKEPAPSPAMPMESGPGKPKADPGRFVADLLYCKDVYAASPFEKSALTAVINRIKKRYALDPAATR